MTKLSFATALAALAIELAGPALADGGSGSSVPPPGPVVIHEQTPTSGANPHTPFGIDPYVPSGVWSRH